ncbi:MAG TPA: HAMP domain-containing sensor histidine kinase [Gaiellaceae bacterium]|jgi:signal transduction histidine kinase|nr:HAMP domain-containing sensor histidine kinase [Gaiellaceae bacterium]
MPRGKILRRRVRPRHAGETAQALPVALPVIVVGAVTTGAAVAALVRELPATAALLGAAGLLAAAVVAEAFPLPIEGVNPGAASLASVFIVGAAAIYGWPTAAALGVLTTVGAELAVDRPLVRVAYNASIYVCAGAAAGLAAAAVGTGDLLAIVAGAFLAAAAFYAVDMVLLSALVARRSARPFFASARLLLSSTGVPFLVMASLTATLIVLWHSSPFVSVVLIGPLLAIAFYQRWVHGALERLREFDRLKDEFIAVMSHELRTPLTSVYGAALTLQRREVKDDVRESLLSIMSSEAERLGRLLDEVLSASRLDTGGEEAVIEPTDAVTVAADVVSAARSRFPDGVGVELVAQEDVPPAAADPDKLRQVLFNLVENAIKYSPEGGLVRVELARAGRQARISVCDQGLGIPTADQERIFEKFHRLDPNMTRGVGGSGLGLYICRELVERMHGRIWVTSEVGSGSTFTFELPLDRGS